MAEGEQAIEPVLLKTTVAVTAVVPMLLVNAGIRRMPP
jgi:hypothetical protein